tara:strand:+ start:82 stop:375 length:294 start_codon:yes stop_codon:yes gene_type:complete
MQLAEQIEQQVERIEFLKGEIKALRVAHRFIEADLKRKSFNLTQMKDYLVRMKASVKGKERYQTYKDKIAEYKVRVKQNSEQKLQEEINEMELKGMI